MWLKYLSLGCYKRVLARVESQRCLRKIQDSMQEILVLGHFGHGHFGHGRFDQDISATDILATDNSATGHFGHRK